MSKPLTANRPNPREIVCLYEGIWIDEAKLIFASHQNNVLQHRLRSAGWQCLRRGARWCVNRVGEREVFDLFEIRPDVAPTK